MRASQITEYKRPRVRGKVSDKTTQSVKQILPGDYRLVDYFKKLGWNSIGSGYFSEVFANPKKNYVVKVNKFPDRSYERFVDFVKCHPNKHFPVVGDVKLITLNDGKFYLYTLERLEKFTSPQNGVDTKIVAALLQRIGLNPDSDLDDIVDRIFNITILPNSQYRNIKEWINQQPGLVKAARILGFNRGKSNFDIHKENIMQRKDGTIVITDPYGVYN